jgi:hypothetical protein
MKIMLFLFISFILSQMDSVTGKADLNQTVAQECSVRSKILSGRDDAATLLGNRQETRLILLT